MSLMVAERAAAPLARHSLRRYLVAMVLAALLPAFAAAGLALWRAATAYREASTQALLDTSRTLARAVESELDRSVTVLRTLAASPVADDPFNLPAWLEQVGAQLHGRLVLVNPALPSPENHPVLIDTARAAMLSGAVSVSDLYDDAKPLGPGASATLDPEAAALTMPGAIASLEPRAAADAARQSLAAPSAMAEPRVALAVPRGIHDAPPIALVLETSPLQLVRALQQRPAASTGLLVAVTDGSGRVVARSRDAVQVVGSVVPDWARLQALGGDGGVFTARGVEGGETMFGFERLRGTPGWVLVVGEPLEAYAARWQQPLLGIAAGGVFALLLAVGGAVWLGRVVLRPVAALAQRAQLIGAGRDAAPPMPVAPTPVREFEALRTSLALAEKVLRERADAERLAARSLAESERRHRTLVQAGALTLWRCDSHGAMTAADGWQDLTGQRAERWRRFGWLDRVIDDDRNSLVRAWQAAVQAQCRFDAEFRVAAPDAPPRWVRARGAPVIDETGRLLEWIGTVEDVDERYRAQARLAHMASHDALTGLPNRARFRQALEAAILRAGRGDAGALLCVDLDRFKDVNDSLGHPVGDVLMTAASRRLTQLVRNTDLVARLGGDEFAIVESEVRGPADASMLASRVIDALGAPYDIGGRPVVCGASVGVVMIANTGADADALLRKADMALYRAKESGRGRYSFFEPEMDARMRLRRELEQALRLALERGEFELHYQALVEVDGRRLSGFEALMRWRHPQRGLVLPDEFVPLAEDIGLIVALGEWALREACREAARWPLALRVAVNVSAVQLERSELVDHVSRALRDSGLAASRLEVEVSERSVLTEGDIGIDTLRQLKSRGVRIAMDDFGTGASSLGCLSSVPFDKVKIDRSFVAGLGLRRDAEVIVRGIIRLCEGLGLATTAEGVETESQFDHLALERCTEVQGWWLGAAQPANQLPAVIERLGAQPVPLA